MSGPRRCSKCGEWMRMIISYGMGEPIVSWECPYGCIQDYIKYTTNISTDNSAIFEQSITSFSNISISRYCSKKQCMCENANDRGYCEFTACIYEGCLNRGFNQNEK